MSRAVNVNASQSAVTTVCARMGLSISAIEGLTPAGTRVVLTNGPAAEAVRSFYGTRVLTGAVERVLLRPRRR